MELSGGERDEGQLSRIANLCTGQEDGEPKNGFPYLLILATRPFQQFWLLAALRPTSDGSLTVNAAALQAHNLNLKALREAIADRSGATIPKNHYEPNYC